MNPLFAVFGLGLPEIAIVGVVILLLFGNRLPTMMRSLGRGIVEFKKGAQGIEDESESTPPGPKSNS